VAGFEPESIERGFQSSSLLTITAAPYILGVARKMGSDPDSPRGAQRNIGV
jgi:hypothetical protein